MPTGYTADVGDGKVTDFRTFALICARQFGACIMQRDDPTNEPPKHREPSDYYEKALKEARQTLVWLRALSLEDAEEEAEREYREDVKRQEEYAAKRAETRRRYEAMLVEVELWTPPTAHHVGMKEFMRKQLVESIEFDCSDYPHQYPTTDAREWLTTAIKRAMENVGRYAEEAEKERARCADSNAWIDTLYASLEPVTASAGRGPSDV